MKEFVFVSIDPGFVTCGVAVGRCNIDRTISYIDKHIFKSSPDQDYSFIYKEMKNFFENIFKAISPDFVIIEDVDLRPFISRRTQTLLFGSIAIILSVIPKDSGYLLVSRSKVLGFFGLKKKKKKEVKKFFIDKYKEYMKGIPEKDREHLADAFALAEATIKSDLIEISQES